MKSRRKSRRKSHGGPRPGAGRPALPVAETAPIAPPPPPALPAHLQKYWDTRGPHFRMCFDHLPVCELTDLLQSCLENEGNPNWYKASPEPISAPTDSRGVLDYPTSVESPPTETASCNPLSLQHGKIEKQDVFNDQAVTLLPIAPSPPPDQLSTVTGDPYGRQDHPQNPEAYFQAYQDRQAEEEAARRWLIQQVRES
jgi:hypothetical protein